ncbi:MAG: shikimate kinase [Bacteroidetes bacterium]|nr:MAG: shikimate kinase [Bacteroidota bacterium]REK33668.1 MAG: shikimate kinase [Bacteroidota bacterium]REK48654.1 MAG: shikimate kinase [Bacteroidota bacterium]
MNYHFPENESNFSAMKIFLIGYMGSGKSRLSKSLASKLGFLHFDTDDLIEIDFGKNISDIFKTEGEEKFRKRESFILKELRDTLNAVVATGGGLPCFENNMEWMNDNGLTVYLEATPRFLFQRLKSSSAKRPLLEGFTEDELLEYITTHLEVRKKFYEQASLKVNAVSLSSSKLAKLISDRIQSN